MKMPHNLDNLKSLALIRRNRWKEILFLIIDKFRTKSVCENQIKKVVRNSIFKNWKVPVTKMMMRTFVPTVTLKKNKFQLKKLKLAKQWYPAPDTGTQMNPKQKEKITCSTKIPRKMIDSENIPSRLSSIACNKSPSKLNSTAFRKTKSYSATLIWNTNKIWITYSQVTVYHNEARIYFETVYWLDKAVSIQLRF